jgi:hypothetical protein
MEEHLAELKEGYNNTDEPDEYYEGSIETLEHLLAKFGESDGRVR